MADASPALTDWLAGAIDVHVHAAPSFFPRWGDGAAVAAAARAAGMAGVLLKAHEGSTVEAAAALTATHSPLKVAGGVVLNRYVGGVNPAAADAALRLGGRCVWLPTIDADDHVRVYGRTGAYDAQHGGAEDGEPLAVLDVDGELTAAAREVLALARDADAFVATGHVSAAAVERVVAASEDMGGPRVLAQHPCFTTPALDLQSIVRLATRGGFVELTYLSVSPMWATTTLDACVAVLHGAPRGTVVVSSDAGQPHNPSPPEALRAFVQSLLERGAPRDALRAAIADVPRQLLGW